MLQIKICSIIRRAAESVSMLADHFLGTIGSVTASRDSSRSSWPPVRESLVLENKFHSVQIVDYLTWFDRPNKKGPQLLQIAEIRERQDFSTAYFPCRCYLSKEPSLLTIMLTAMNIVAG